MSYKTELRKTNPAFNFGPWWDHYVRPFGKCHPDFDTHVIGDDVRGVKVCTRRNACAMTAPPLEPVGAGTAESPRLFIDAHDGRYARLMPYAMPLGGDPRGMADDIVRPMGDYSNSGNVYDRTPSPHSWVPDDRFALLHAYRRVNLPYDGVGIGAYARYPVRW